jgi:hypothetical protein
MVVELEGNQFAEAVGKYLVLYQDNVGKYVAKVLEVDEENLKMRYEVITGEYKGKIRRGRYVTNRAFALYDDESLVKALLESGEAAGK